MNASFKQFIVGGILSAALVIGFSLPSAHAVPNFYDLTLPFTWGPLNGQTFTGNFSIEGNELTGVGTEKFTLPSLASGPGFTGAIRSFDITVGPSVFNLSHMIPRSSKPNQVVFIDGILSEISLLLKIGLGGAQLEFLPSDDHLYEFEYTPGVGGTGAGIGSPGIVAGTFASFASLTLQNGSNPVPEPSSVVFLLSGLLMLGGMAYRRKLAINV